MEGCWGHPTHLQQADDDALPGKEKGAHWLRTSGLRRRSLSRKQRQKQSIEEWEMLVEAIMRRDVRAARKAAIQHVASAAKSALDF